MESHLCPVPGRGILWRSSLDTAAAVAAGQLLDLSNGDHVVVAADGVLQSGSRNRELNRSLSVLSAEQSINQTAAEGVTAANAVDDGQVVLLGEAVVLAVIEHCGPAVVGGGVALAQGDGDLLKAEGVSQLLGNGLVALVVDGAAVDVGGLGLDAEDILGILLVGDADIDVLGQLGHGFPGLGAGPQLAAVVQVAGDLDAAGLSSLACVQADFDHIGAQSGSDAGEVEPIGAVEDLIPIEVLAGGQLDGGVGTVIDADGAALGSALLVIVDTNTVAAADDQRGVHTVAAQAVHSGLTDGMSGQLGDESGIHAVVGQGDGDIGLAAAKGEFNILCLDETLIVEGLQTEHQLAEGDDSCHYLRASLTISTDFLHSSVISSHLPSAISLSGHM